MSVFTKLLTALLLFSTLSFVSSMLIAQNKTYELGDKGPTGGWVFYDKGYYSNGWQYLEAAPSDQSEGIQWSNGKDIETGAIADKLGAGKTNTKLIIKSQGKGNYAAKICSDYRGGGKSDWFLPTREELREIIGVLHENGIGDFSNKAYWSSTDGEDGSYAFFVRFDNRNSSGTSKSAKLSVRAIRAF